MGITIDVVRVACNTSTGNQTITGSLGGLTPKAALFFLTKATTDGTAIDGWSYGYGAATGTSNRWFVTFGSQHNVTTTETNSQNSGSGCIGLHDETTTSTLECEADFVSFNANNVIINWSNAPSAACLLTVVLFAGSDLSAKADRFSLENSVGVKDNTSVGFEPDVVFCIGQQRPNTPWPQNAPSFGFVSNDGSETQRMGFADDRDARSTSESHLVISSTNAVRGITNITTDWIGTFQDFDADGFSVNITNAGANNYLMGYLALAFGGAVGHKIITHTTPTSTGSQASTAIGFKPQAVIGITSRLDSDNASSFSGDTITAFGMCFWDASDQYSNTCASSDGQSTSDTQSLSDDQAVNVPDDDGSSGLAATLTSFDTNGFTLNWSAVESSARYFYLLAIEEEAAAVAGDSIPYLSNLNKKRFQKLLVR